MTSKECKQARHVASVVKKHINRHFTGEEMKVLVSLFDSYGFDSAKQIRFDYDGVDYDNVKLSGVCLVDDATEYQKEFFECVKKSMGEV